MLALLELDISRNSLQRILTKDLHLDYYKVQFVQELYPTLTTVSMQQQVDVDFSNNINDEAHFHSDGFVNRQNYRNWSSPNPRVTVDKQMHAECVIFTVWCTFWVVGIIRSFY